MAVIMTCDHHAPSGHIEKSRSRRVMVDQLRAAVALGDALANLGETKLALDPRVGPVVTLTMDQVQLVWDALQAWRAIAPRPGEDLEYGDGDPTVRVPPEGPPATPLTEASTAAGAPSQPSSGAKVPSPRG